MSTSFFEELGGKARVQEVLNVLVEAPFFYPSDDPDLFAYLRRHREPIGRFFEETFGWQLVIDARFARLYKPRWHNHALKRSQQGLFALTRKDDCVAFLLVLDFYERLLEERGGSVDDVEPVRFEMGELFAHAKERMESGETREPVDDDDVRRLFRDLVPQLLRYRFLREVQREREDGRSARSLAPDRTLYECLPGLHTYDVRALDETVIRDVLGGRAGDGVSGEEMAS